MENSIYRGLTIRCQRQWNKKEIRCQLILPFPVDFLEAILVEYELVYLFLLEVSLLVPVCHSLFHLTYGGSLMGFIKS